MPDVESLSGAAGAESYPVNAPLTADARALDAVISTMELVRRPSRVPDFEAENRALVTLIHELAFDPTNVLQPLTNIALRLCRAHSAGVSLLNGDKTRFFWPAVAGQWAAHVGGGTPRDFGPCGTVLDRDASMMFTQPQRVFQYLNDVTPGIEEALLVPFKAGEETVGTVWAVIHDSTRRFDSEDLRLLTNLSTFASAAYQAINRRA